MDPIASGAILEPVPRELRDLLRRAVAEHARSEHRRQFPPSVHVGVPGQVSTVLELGDTPLDHSLRTDAVEAMVRAVDRPGQEPLVWLVRCGATLTLGVDLAWLAAARSAGGELGRPLPMVVVTRRSWRDPQTGVGRTWTRLRAAAAP